MTSDPFQILSDCPHCLVESAVVELYDHHSPCSHLGIALESRCRFCGLETRGELDGHGEIPVHVSHKIVDERCPRCQAHLTEEEHNHHRCPYCGLGAVSRILRSPSPLHTVEDVRARLDLWAREEGCHDAAELLDVSFDGQALEDITAKILRRERVETSFDVLGFLFSHIGNGAANAQPTEGDAPVPGVHHTRAEEELAPAPTSRIELPGSRAPHRRNRIYPLISVMVVDGEVREAERSFIESMLREEGLEPLQHEEIRVHRPHEVGPVGSLIEREKLIQLMIQLAHIDLEKDESEMRMIRDFARHWGVDPARVDAWEAQEEDRSATGMRRFLMRLKALLYA